MQRYTPLSCKLKYSPVNALSVPSLRVTSNCNGVNCCLHSSSVLRTFLTRIGPTFCPESSYCMTFTVSLSSDACDIGLRIHSAKLAPATVAREFAKNCRRVNIDPPITRSAKRERECLHAWIQELNLECPIFHRPLLPDQLIQPVPLHCS